MFLLNPMYSLNDVARAAKSNNTLKGNIWHIFILGGRTWLEVSDAVDLKQNLQKRINVTNL